MLPASSGYAASTLAKVDVVSAIWVVDCSVSSNSLTESLLQDRIARAGSK